MSKRKADFGTLEKENKRTNYFAHSWETTSLRCFFFFADNFFFFFFFFFFFADDFFFLVISEKLVELLEPFQNATESVSSETKITMHKKESSPM